MARFAEYFSIVLIGVGRGCFLFVGKFCFCPCAFFGLVGQLFGLGCYRF